MQSWQRVQSRKENKVRSYPQNVHNLCARIHLPSLQKHIILWLDVFKATTSSGLVFFDLAAGSGGLVTASSESSWQIQKKSHECANTRGLLVNKATRRSLLPSCTISFTAIIVSLIVHPKKQSSTIIDGGGLWRVYVIALCLSVNILENASAGLSMFARTAAVYLAR